MSLQSIAYVNKQRVYVEDSNQDGILDLGNERLAVENDQGLQNLSPEETKAYLKQFGLSLTSDQLKISFVKNYLYSFEGFQNAIRNGQADVVALYQQDLNRLAQANGINIDSGFFDSQTAQLAQNQCHRLIEDAKLMASLGSTIVVSDLLDSAEVLAEQGVCEEFSREDLETLALNKNYQQMLKSARQADSDGYPLIAKERLKQAQEFAAKHQLEPITE